jgi:carbonic anhydrase/acetyltransferase-like protein (isoleucine patch superfamily)
MVRSYKGIRPIVHPSAYVDASAQVIGDVVLGERASVWPCASIRGDVGRIVVGNDSNIQDCAVLHMDDGFPLVIGERVTVGHSVTLHGCVIEDDCLIGIGAIILNGARIGRGSVIAAGALVPERAEIPANSLVMGVPGKVKRAVSPEEQARFAEGVKHYVEKAALYRAAEADAPK